MVSAVCLSMFLFAYRLEQNKISFKFELSQENISLTEGKDLIFFNPNGSI